MEKKAFSEEDERENFLQTPPPGDGSKSGKTLDTSVGTELFRLKHFANG